MTRLQGRPFVVFVLIDVRNRPTIDVLDADGRVRYKDIRGKAVDEAVDTLLAELAKKAGTKQADKKE